MRFFMKELEEWNADKVLKVNQVKVA